MLLFTSRVLSSFVISLSSSGGVLTDRLWGVMSPLGSSFKIRMATLRPAISQHHGELLQGRTQHTLEQSTNPRNAAQTPSYLFAYPKVGRIPEFLHFLLVQVLSGSSEHLLTLRAKLSVPLLQQKSGTDHNDSVSFSEKGFLCFLEGRGNYLSRRHFLKGKYQFWGENAHQEPKGLTGTYYRLELGMLSVIGGEFGNALV